MFPHTFRLPLRHEPLKDKKHEQSNRIYCQSIGRWRNKLREEHQATFFQDGENQHVDVHHYILVYSFSRHDTGRNLHGCGQS